MTDETKRRNEEKAASVPRADTLTPADRYQELFIAVQMAGVFDDSKTFVDCVPRGDPEDILESYREQCDDEGFDLSDFVHANFDDPLLALHMEMLSEALLVAAERLIGDEAYTHGPSPCWLRRSAASW